MLLAAAHGQVLLTVELLARAHAQAPYAPPKCPQKASDSSPSSLTADDLVAVNLLPPSGSGSLGNLFAPLATSAFARASRHADQAIWLPGPFHHRWEVVPSSPVAILMTLTALPITSAGRFWTSVALASFAYIFPAASRIAAIASSTALIRWSWRTVLFCRLPLIRSQLFLRSAMKFCCCLQ